MITVEKEVLDGSLRHNRVEFLLEMSDAVEKGECECLGKDIDKLIALYIKGKYPEQGIRKELKYHWDEVLKFNAMLIPYRDGEK
jgi:hypothetical protein